MKLIHATVISGFLLTALVLYGLSYLPFIPAWAIFMAWACFFHMEGGVQKNQAYFATITHMGLGAVAAWASALLVMNNPLPAMGIESIRINALWAPVLIAAMIAMLLRMSVYTRFCITPAIIYGYACVWAFASTPGLLTTDMLLSLSFGNALIAVMVCIVLGASCGYVNACMVSQLCNLRLPPWFASGHKKTASEITVHALSKHELKSR